MMTRGIGSFVITVITVVVVTVTLSSVLQKSLSSM